MALRASGASPATGRAGSRDAGRLAAWVVLCAVLTAILQSWVGDYTLYGQLADSKRGLHRAILTNQLPEGVTWETVGGNGTNLRVFTVYLAEGLRRLTGLPLLGVYRAIDSTALFGVLLGLVFYLRRWFEDEYCLIGVLVFSLAAVMSYHLFYFHPWDRPSQLVWLLLLALIRDGRSWQLGLALAVAMTIKYDVVFAPALYFLAAATRETLSRAVATTALLFAVTIGMLWALQTALPGGIDRPGFATPGGAWVQLGKNWDDLLRWGLVYPPLLAFAIPSALAWLHLRRKQRFLAACTIYAHVLFALHAALSNFQEVRALLYLLIVLLPSSLWSLRALLRGPP